MYGFINIDTIFFFKSFMLSGVTQRRALSAGFQNVLEK